VESFGANVETDEASAAVEDVAMEVEGEEKSEGEKVAAKKGKKNKNQEKQAKYLQQRKRQYCERFLEFLVDLLSQLNTRRFLRTLVVDHHVLVRCRMSPLGSIHPDGVLFRQLLERLSFYQDFEINDHTAKAVSQQDMESQRYLKVKLLQRLAFKHFKDSMKDFALCAIGSVSTKEELSKHLSVLNDAELENLGQRLCLFPDDKDQIVTEWDSTISTLASPTDTVLSKRFLGDANFKLDVLVSTYEKRVSQIDQINRTPLFPTERLLWDTNMVPSGRFYGDRVLPLPKLNLQFLTFHDYLLRSFNLFRLESAYQVREDLKDSIKRMGAVTAVNNETQFTGWARMATSLNNFSVVEVSKPALGQTAPEFVRGEINFSTAGMKHNIREEWDTLKEHDVLFLISLKPVRKEKTLIRQGQNAASAHGGGEGGDEREMQEVEDDATFTERYGISAVRGCEVKELLDEDGKVMNEMGGRPNEGPPAGKTRTLRVLMDPMQYQLDMSEGTTVYDELNLIIRRDPKTNNFKAILETIRDLMNLAAVGKAVPSWLHDIFLGYGDPAAAHYRRMNPNKVAEAQTASRLDLTHELKKGLYLFDFKDTFVDLEHVKDTYAAREDGEVDSGLKYEVRIMKEGDDETEYVAGSGDSCPLPPYKLTFKQDFEAQTTNGEKGVETITAYPYRLPNMGPYPENEIKKNKVRFTPVQMEAVRSGMCPGLTMVVGPPGTGKTDVAVQIIANLYASNPNGRTLVVAHSNQALNDLFEKVMERDIHERHLLRLGFGGKSLDTDKDFSKWGRVNYTLARRLELLKDVEKLAGCLGFSSSAGDVAYTCESAGFFNLCHVKSRVEKFDKEIAELVEKGQATDGGAVAKVFPFGEFFEDAPAHKMFQDGYSFEANLEIAKGCFRHLQSMFTELKDYSAFELLRSHKKRGDYLLTKQARIVAMTCTHAALTRSNLVKLGFKYDNLVVEESAQILEVETFIPMLLQNHDSVEGCRLKRVVLIGDHHQLPPVVQNMAFQKYGKLDQSLFARFIRLGTPHVQLDKQGRARTEIAHLYRWRYQGLGDLPVINQKDLYKTANAGFANEFQMINVEDFQGRGESTPSPFFYQNLGEAEYVVAVYQYMRLLGYPAERISILSTYNGQKDLIRDILEKRCAPFDFFGMPARVTTADK
jgi:intron-binding protein aquarius